MESLNMHAHQKLPHVYVRSSTSCFVRHSEYVGLTQSWMKLSRKLFTINY